MTTVLLAMCVVLLAVCAAGAWYFVVVVPRRWRAPLQQALVLLEREQSERADLEKADRLLDEAMNAGPRGRDLADARFAQAFVRAMLGTYQPDNYWAAAATIDGLVTTTDQDPATVQLALWLQHKLERHERAVELYERHADSLADRPTARRAAAASHLHLAGRHWRRGRGREETDQVIHHFDRVSELGVLVDEIPMAADNLHVLKGMQSFFDHRFEDARAAFETARERAIARERVPIEAELGLVACDWPAGDLEELDRRLHEIQEAVGSGEELDESKLDTNREYVKLTRSVVALLRLMVLLREWVQSQPASVPDESDRLELWRLAHALREADPELGDPHLVEGLIQYYFALGEHEREASLTILEEGMSTAKGIVVPEVLQLVERERALGSQGDALSRFLRLVHEFLADPTVSAQHRDELRSLRDQFARHTDDFGDDMPLPHRATSSHELRRRIDAMRRRIELIVYPSLRDLPEDAPARVVLRERLAELDEVAASFTERARVLDQSEHTLVMTTGQFLLPQEEREEDHAAADPDDVAEDDNE